MGISPEREQKNSVQFEPEVVRQAKEGRVPPRKTSLFGDREDFEFEVDVFLSAGDMRPVIEDGGSPARRLDERRLLIRGVLAKEFRRGARISHARP